MKGHWLKVIQVGPLGFLAGVRTDTGSSLISYSGMKQRRSENQKPEKASAYLECVAGRFLKTTSLIYLNGLIGNCSSHLAAIRVF